ncbi:MAG: RNA polymerase subunit sigma-70 [Marinilabiliales bacterium]|nr:MAG: RNA polymerase subunit sigma-70 [Marinilabiliales bacterium]
MNFNDKDFVDSLIKKCVKGDRKSQHLLYKSFYGKMLVVCMRYASHHEEAKDLLHDGFIKVFERLTSFQNKGSLEGWIRRIIINNCIDFIRKKRDYLIQSDEKGFENLEDDSDNDADFQAEIKLKAELVIKLIQKLSPAYRTVFNMFVIENYSHQEIADELNISVGASKSNLAKAKMKLRDLFNSYRNELEK